MMMLLNTTFHRNLLAGVKKLCEVHARPNCWMTKLEGGRVRDRCGEDMGHATAHRPAPPTETILEHFAAPIPALPVPSETAELRRRLPAPW